MGTAQKPFFSNRALLVELCLLEKRHLPWQPTTPRYERYPKLFCWCAVHRLHRTIHAFHLWPCLFEMDTNWVMCGPYSVDSRKSLSLVHLFAFLWEKTGYIVFFFVVLLEPFLVLRVYLPLQRKSGGILLSMYFVLGIQHRLNRETGSLTPDLY